MMLNTEKFKFWIVPNNINDVSSWIDSNEIVKRGRKPLADKRTSAYYTYADPKYNLHRQDKIDARNKRDQEFIYLFTKEAKTLKEIGDIYGLSRERVRQRLKKCGYDKEVGGASLRSVINKIHGSKNHSTRELKCLNYYGCSREVLAGYGDHNKHGSLPMAYKNQKKNAKLRGIEFKLTFPEWIRIWEQSGHLNERGLGSGKYVMSRICDLGAYEESNVVIKTHNENSQESREMDRIKGRWA